MIYCIEQMDEIDAVIEVIEDEASKIWNNTKGSADGKGKIGELICRRVIKQCFFDRGYKLRTNGNETFAVYKEDKKMGGPDFIVEFTDSTGKLFTLLLEVKNWGYYKNGISRSNFRKWILSKYTKVDKVKKRKFYWAVAINKRNIRVIWKNCNRYRINMVPIEEHITDMHINKYNLKAIFLRYMEDLDDLIDSIMLGWINI